MDREQVARAAIVIDAPPQTVWEALLAPEAISVFMFGAKVTSDWREGSPIVWAGEWEGRPYEDRGQVLRVDAPRQLRYTHRSGTAPDADEHTVTIDLTADAGTTAVELRQDNNPDDEATKHSETNWTVMLRALRDYVEQQSADLG